MLVQTDDPTTEALLSRRIPATTPATQWPTAPVEAADDAVLAAVDAWREELVSGRGYVVVDTGTAALDDEAVGSAAWNAFTLLTDVIPQYATGELVYTVEVDASAEAEKVPQGSSHYSRTSATGGHHTDGCLLPVAPDLAMLACVSSAAAGGETIVMDGRSVRDAVAGAGAELLEVLRQPQPFDAAPGQPGPRRPVLTEHADGRVRFNYLRRYIEQGYANLGEEIPADLVRAMDVIDAHTSAEENQTPFLLRRGQVLIFDNTRFVHGRRPFTDGDEGVRRLQRAYGMHRQGAAA